MQALHAFTDGILLPPWIIDILAKGTPWQGQSRHP